MRAKTQTEIKRERKKNKCKKKEDEPTKYGDMAWYPIAPNISNKVRKYYVHKVLSV